MGESQKTMAQAKWFYWAALVAFGAICGLLIIIVINTRSHMAGKSAEQQVAARVGRLVLLPTNETPALATVTDPSKLKSNPLLASTHAGDKILIYAKWKQAIVYRPSINKIIDIGPVDVSAPGGSLNGYSSLN